MGTAWTVFTGTKPEPMQVEILGVLRGARGPGHDMILAQLHGAKPEYTGVVAGMSGSPVYIGNKLLGSLSYPHRAIQQRPHRRHYADRADAGGARSAVRSGTHAAKRRCETKAPDRARTG